MRIRYFLCGLSRQVLNFVTEILNTLTDLLSSLVNLFTCFFCWTLLLASCKAHDK